MTVLLVRQVSHTIYLGNEDKPHCEEAREENGDRNEGVTSVLMRANDERDWCSNQTKHLQYNHETFKAQQFTHL